MIPSSARESDSSLRERAIDTFKHLLRIDINELVIVFLRKPQRLRQEKTPLPLPDNQQLEHGVCTVPQITLDAGTNPPIGVATPQRIAVYVGTTPRQLLIFSGVAIPEWDSQANLDREEVIIRLGAVTTRNFEATAVVGLASVYNDDSDFTFATDSATVDTDPTDGTLRLRVPIAVQGNPSVLNRFSYMVNVLSDPITSKITGLISWQRHFGDPTFAVLKGGNPIFRIAVGETVTIPSPSGGFPSTQFIENTAGYSSMPVLTGDTWVAAYEVSNVPLGRLWQVQPSLLSNALAGPPPGYLSGPGFAPQQVVELTPSTPSANGVDFTMAFGQAPR